MLSYSEKLVPTTHKWHFAPIPWRLIYWEINANDFLYCWALVFLHFAILGPWKRRCHFNVRLSPSESVSVSLDPCKILGLPAAYTWVIGSIVQTLANAGKGDAPSHAHIGGLKQDFVLHWNIHKFLRESGTLLISCGASKTPNELMQIPGTTVGMNLNLGAASKTWASFDVCSINIGENLTTS